ncbi:MAG: phosphatidylglycerophosphatase A [Deltaproteobacteria bacterium]|nr:phosphatidylglycerophosphatase A [Deltaproteobacteria bacterium]MBW1953079.1 phosphatidylglycerophosphatase A [Deltaproteobacteria bacterium]MBW1987176.1 phosphatidylglycerophosphatase A [Deltaproteobacteria bacterium]MBW2135038.1 phosphatidylglycerophosphatase A [Deltaproteobacteria bacterium]
MNKKLILALATVGGVGYLPLMPGTWGSLAAVPLWWVLGGLKPVDYGALLFGLLVLGIWVTGSAEVYLGQSDASPIVLDEVIGLLITLAGRPRHWGWVMGGFLLFRGLDIWKPFPIYLINEQIKGGVGIVLDDVLAGIYAWIVLTLISRVI